MKIRVNGREYQLIGNTTTLGEQRTIKRILGRPITAVGDIDPADPDVVVAVIWLAMHREDSRVTVEQVDAMTLADIELDFTDEEEAAAKATAELEALPPPPAPAAPDGQSESASGENGSGAPGSVISSPETSPATSGSPA